MRCGVKWTTAEMRVQKGQTVIAAPLQAIRDLRDRFNTVLALIGLAQADADALIEAEETKTEQAGPAEGAL